MLRTLTVVALVAAACDKGQKPAPKPAPTPHVIADAAVRRPDAAPSEDPSGPPPAPTVKAAGKGDCKTAYAPRPGRDPNPMCKVDGGVFMMGDDTSDDPNLKPAHKEKVAPFYIDQFEVTVAQVVFYLNTVKNNDCPTAPDGRCFSIDGAPKLIVDEHGTYRVATAKDGHNITPDPYKSGVERIPFDTASFEGAARYCAWAGKRLPTSAEFEFAARYDPKTGKDLRYPWGDRFKPNQTNCDQEDCKDEFESEAPVGSFDGSHGRGNDSSPWGAYDLTGNAGEFTADCYAPYRACSTPCADQIGAADLRCKHVLRTGSFSAPKDVTEGASRGRVLGGGESSGFRCAR